jgi:hypothetical protein
MTIKNGMKTIITVYVLLTVIPLFAQSEEDLDSMLLTDSASSMESGSEKKSNNWKLYGFFENSNHVAMPATSSIDDYSIIKAEARGNLNAAYSVGNFYGKAILDVYFYPENMDGESSTTDAYHQWGRIEARELYVGWGKSLQFRLGKQLYNWGTADVFNVTNYLDQPDMREFITKDSDDTNRGALSISAKYLLGDFAIEGVLLPVHSPTLAPQGFWELEPEVPGFNTVVNTPEARDATLKNVGLALRGGGTVGQFDFHLSYFTGYNQDLLYNRELSGESFAARTIELTPWFNRRHTLGFDCAASIDKLSLRAETSFTFNMPGIAKQNDAALEQLVQYWQANPGYSIEQVGMDLTAAGMDISSSVQTDPYINYVIGADYNLWGDNGRVLVEWVQGFYLDNNDSYERSLFDSVLLMRVEDKQLQERLTGEVGAMVRLVQKNPGAGIFYEVGWDFKNGFTLAQGGYFFIGNDDDLFETVKDKDMLYCEARYSF